MKQVEIVSVQTARFSKQRTTENKKHVFPFFCSHMRNVEMQTVLKAQGFWFPKKCINTKEAGDKSLAHQSHPMFISPYV